jgi:hypothetical protein
MIPFRPAAFLAALTLMACARAEAPPAEQAAAPAAPNVVSVTATEFAYTMADTLPAGWTSFQMTNAGQELHHMTLVRLEEGKTLDDLMQAMGTPGPAPAWAVFLGGPNAVVGPMVSDVTLDLAPGNYAVLCVIPSPNDGKPHVMKGMSKAFTVVPSDVVRAAPVEDLTLTLSDYAFTWSAPVTPGRHVVKVVNTATQDHELILAQLAPGKSVGDMVKFIADMEKGAVSGPPPGMPWGGIANMAPGHVNYITLDLPAGEYGEICVAPDAKDGKPHAAHGMVAQLSVK